VRAWAFVAGQFALLAALVVLPSAAVGPTIDVQWLRPLGYGLIFVGGAVLVVAGLHLGEALTPSPHPRDGARLRTNGLYRFVRHPIYSGVLLVGWGLGLRSMLWVGLVLAVALTAWMTAKARYEEQLLTARYPDYPAYAATTPRFLPAPRRPGPSAHDQQT
jgi:protein-S-isoprenylcysteine O-methyltransferase Ste14